MATILVIAGLAGAVLVAGFRPLTGPLLVALWPQSRCGGEHVAHSPRRLRSVCGHTPTRTEGC
jgi:hypothetical protein